MWSRALVLDRDDGRQFALRSALERTQSFAEILSARTSGEAFRLLMEQDVDVVFVHWRVAQRLSTCTSCACDRVLMAEAHAPLSGLLALQASLGAARLTVPVEDAALARVLGVLRAA